MDRHYNHIGQYESTKPDWMNPLHTDHYQMTMSYAYWRSGRLHEPAIFEAFFRKHPFDGKYCIFAGVDEVLQFLKTFKFEPSHIAYLKQVMPNVEEDYLNWLSTLDTTQIKVYGMRAGRLVFAREPLFRVEGPIGILQLLETPILNMVNFATLVCTNASRMKAEAGLGKVCIEFGLRRAQGPNGGLSASKYSYLGGFDGTSNVYAGYLYGIPISGTHAHSFVMSFAKEEDLTNRILDGVDLLAKALHYRSELGWETTELTELYAFISYSVSFPSAFLALVDSYSTLNSGVKNFLLVALALDDLGYKAIGIRLDSGDLAYLSKEARIMFTQTASHYGKDFSNFKIVASNDINENSLKELKASGHEIDTFGIGTNLVTCQAQPALGMVYKLVQINNEPRIKLSDQPEKTTLPGAKTVIRVFHEDKPSFDVICMEGEEKEYIKILEQSEGDRSLLFWKPFSNESILTEPKRIEVITELLYDGQTDYMSTEESPCDPSRLKQQRADSTNEFKMFGGYERLIDKSNKVEYDVYVSDQCKHLLDEQLMRYHMQQM